MHSLRIRGIFFILLLFAGLSMTAHAQQPFAPTCEAQPACGAMREAVMAGVLEMWLSNQGKAWRKQQPAATKTLRQYAARPPKGAGVTPDLLPAGKTAFGRGIEVLLLAYKLTRGESLVLP